MAEKPQLNTRDPASSLSSSVSVREGDEVFVEEATLFIGQTLQNY
jgi:hypothetical protein